MNGSPSPWIDTNLEMLCYLESANRTPDFEVVSSSIGNAFEQSFISTSTCTQGIKEYGKVDIRMTQLSNGNSLLKKLSQVAAFLVEELTARLANCKTAPPGRAS